jgi:ectoine hydroxylase-related dioxygenase (phytanoyl-CoA dioxygenase family)
MTTDLTIETALRDGGVTETTLTAQEKSSLDQDGYIVLPAVYGKALLSKLQTAFEQIAANQRQNISGKKSGTRHPGNLLNTDADFVEACLHSRNLAAVHYVLKRDFRLTQCAGRDPLPGYGQQGLHTDWMPRNGRDPFFVATAICLLDDFTKDNGSTRVVPGTHRMSGAVPRVLADPASHHSEETVVTGKAGSVLIFNGHLWHSGTRNNNQQPRRALQCVFHAREIIPPFAQPVHSASKLLPPAIGYFLKIN